MTKSPLSSRPGPGAVDVAIAQNSADILENQNEIAQNDADIDDNLSAIQANQSEIASNDADIVALQAVDTATAVEQGQQNLRLDATEDATTQNANDIATANQVSVAILDEVQDIRDRSILLAKDWSGPEVQVAGRDDSVWGTGTESWEGLSVNGSGDSIVRQSGTITRMVLNSSTIAGGFKVKVLRPAASWQYEVVQDTGLMLTPDSSDGDHHTFNVNLETQTGDRMLLYCPPGSKVRTTFNQFGNSESYAGDPALDAIITLTGGNPPEPTPDVAYYATKPYFASTGDGILEGHNTGTHMHSLRHAVWGEAWGNIYADPSYIAQQLLNNSKNVRPNYQNHGHYEQTLDWVLSTGIVQALSGDPEVLWIHAGRYDIEQGDTWTEMEPKLDAIRAYVPIETRIILTEILPWTDASDAQAAEIRNVNASLPLWCANNTVDLVKCHDDFGQNRVSTGELDDMKTEYDQDGTYLTELGVEEFGELIAIALNDGLPVRLAHTDAIFRGVTLFEGEDSRIGLGVTTPHAKFHMHQKEDLIALRILSDAPGAAALFFQNPATEHANVIDVQSASDLTTGGMIRLQSDSVDTSERYLVEVINQSTLATGAVMLRLDQASTADIIQGWGAGSQVFRVTGAGDVGIKTDSPVAGGGLTTVGLVNTGKLHTKVTRVTTTYTVLVTDSLVFGNTDGGSWVASLPAGVQNQRFKIVNTGSSGNTLDISPDGSEHLLGVNSDFTLNDGESLEISYDATDGWY